MNNSIFTNNPPSVIIRESVKSTIDANLESLNFSDEFINEISNTSMEEQYQIIRYIKFYAKEFSLKYEEGIKIVRAIGIVFSDVIKANREFEKVLMDAFYSKYTKDFYTEEVYNTLLLVIKG